MNRKTIGMERGIVPHTGTVGCNDSTSHSQIVKLSKLSNCQEASVQRAVLDCARRMHDTGIRCTWSRDLRCLASELLNFISPNFAAHARIANGLVPDLMMAAGRHGGMHGEAMKMINEQSELLLK